MRPTAITITPETLRAALLLWEQQARAGNWPRDTSSPAEDIAQRNTEYLWPLLANKPR